jgi:hypothetical protein
MRTPNEQHDMEKDHEKIHSSNDTSETATLHRTKTQEQIDEEKRDEEITHLARRYTSQSYHSAYTKNPFEEREREDWENSVLNPASSNFKPRAFAKSLLNLEARDPEKWKQRTAGFAFKDLSVFGFGSGTDYQKDVVSRAQFQFGEGVMGC